MRRRRALGENASTYRRAGRDAERAGRTEEAEAIYAQAPRYRNLGIQKKNADTGKIRKYKDLRAFHDECPIRGLRMICEIQNVRQLTDGTGVASVSVKDPPWRTSGKAGTWRLHYASYDLMLDNLKKRTAGLAKKR